MTQYAALVHNVNVEDRGIKWDWHGFANAESPIEAAAGVAISAQGYDEDSFASDEAIVNKFTDDGWRFRLLEIAEVWDNYGIRQVEQLSE